MLRYVVRRLLGAIPVLFGLTVILFAFIHLLPGDPGRWRSSASTNGPSSSRRFAIGSGLDLPLWQQYLIYMNNLIHGDLGNSFVDNRSVLSGFVSRVPRHDRAERSPPSQSPPAIGIPLGHYAGRRARGLGSDGFVTVISLVGI